MKTRIRVYIIDSLASGVEFDKRSLIFKLSGSNLLITTLIDKLS